MPYINDKELIKMAVVPYFLGNLAIYNGITKEQEKFVELCKTFYLELCNKYNKYLSKEIFKLNKRIEIINRNIILELMDKQTNKVSAHKAILAINSLVQMAFDNNKFSLDYAEKLAILLEPFQEIEARMKLDDKDWFALKESADKKAKKIYEMIF
jgi:hypothetical protein